MTSTGLVLMMLDYIDTNILMKLNVYFQKSAWLSDNISEVRGTVSKCHVIRDVVLAALCLHTFLV